MFAPLVVAAREWARLGAFGRGAEAVLVFGNLLGNGQGILPHREEGGGEVFGSVVGHRLSLPKIRRRAVDSLPAN